MNNKYNEIMDLPHHVSKTRPQMPKSDRTAQFAPFAALTGYDDAVKETGMGTICCVSLIYLFAKPLFNVKILYFHFFNDAGVNVSDSRKNV